MSWTDLISELASIPDAWRLRQRLELDLCGHEVSGALAAFAEGFGGHVDAEMQVATAALVAQGLAGWRALEARPGETRLEQLQEALGARLCSGNWACAGDAYAKHRRSPADEWGAGTRGLRYVSVRTFVRWMMPDGRRHAETLEPGPGVAERVAELIDLFDRQVADNRPEKVRIGPEAFCFVTCDDAQAPHAADRAAEVVRRLALPGFETATRRRRALGIVAFSFPAGAKLQRPTMTECMSNGGRWFFPGPRRVPGDLRIAGRTRPLCASLDAWADGTRNEHGVDEWLHSNVESTFGDGSGDLKRVWYGLFEEAT